MTKDKDVNRVQDNTANEENFILLTIVWLFY